MRDSKPKQHRVRPTPFRDDRILRNLAVPGRLNHCASTTSPASNSIGTRTDYGGPFHGARSRDTFVYIV